jgi:hypothetical protein
LPARSICTSVLVVWIGKKILDEVGEDFILFCRPLFRVDVLFEQTESLVFEEDLLLVGKESGEELPIPLCQLLNPYFPELHIADENPNEDPEFILPPIEFTARLLILLRP